MDPLTIGALITGGASIIGNIVGGAQGTGLSTKQYNQQRALNEEAAATNYWYGEKGAAEQYKRQEQWYANYASPAAMVKQYKDAGLSPALMYGTAGSSGGNVPTGTAAGSGNVQPGNAAAMGMTAQQAKMNSIQTVAVMADAFKKLTDAGLSKAETKKMLIEGNVMAQTAEYNVTNAKIESYSKQIDYAIKEFKELRQRNERWLDENATSVLENRVERVLIQNKKTLSNYDVRQQKIETQVIEASKKELTQLTIQLAKGEITKQKYENAILNWQNNNKNLFKGLEVAEKILGIFKIGATKIY